MKFLMPHAMGIAIGFWLVSRRSLDAWKNGIRCIIRRIRRSPQVDLLSSPQKAAPHREFPYRSAAPSIEMTTLRSSVQPNVMQPVPVKQSDSDTSIQFTTSRHHVYSIALS